MLIYKIIVSIVTLFYASLIGQFIFGWIRIKRFDKRETRPGFLISVIVPFRNEEKKLKSLIDCLSSQSIADESFEVIFVDDNSEDRSAEIINDSLNLNPNFKLLISLGRGKKKAVQQAVDSAKGTLIATTDADCIMGENWLASIAAFYQKNLADLIIGPVKLTGDTFFQKLQKIEFAGLSVTTAGSAAINNPVMCNGANLIFTKDVYKNVNGESGKRFASGDDIFLMTEIKKMKHSSICYLKSEDAIVLTDASVKINDFWQQRKRWVSKNKGIKDTFILYTGLLVFLNNLLIFSIPLLMLFFNGLLWLLIINLGIKTLFDFLLIEAGATFFKIGRIAWMSLLIQPLNIVYTVITGIIGSLSGYRWKNRQY